MQSNLSFPQGFKAAEFFEPDETFVSFCIAAGPAIEVARLCAFDTFFVDGAHMKAAKGATAMDNAQVLIVEQKSAIRDQATKNLPLAITVCLAESMDDYGFTYWTLENAGFSLNRPEVNILHDRGKAVVRAREVMLPRADSFICNQHLIRNVQALSGVGILSEATRQDFLGVTQAVTLKEFDDNFASLLKAPPPNAQEYLKALDKSLYSAYHFEQKTGKAISFMNTNPVEEENQRIMRARWSTHPMEAAQLLIHTWGAAFADHQKLVQSAAQEKSFIFLAIFKQAKPTFGGGAISACATIARSLISL